MENQNQPTGMPGSAPVISIGEWIVTILVLSIPIVNIIMLFVWGFGGNTNLTKANYAKATLIWMLISIAIAIIFFAIFGAALFSFMQSNPDLQQY